MTDSFVTQCPHCQTSFRVSHAQLSVARGVVRCGSCLQVFNAARQLLEQRAAREAASAAATAAPAAAPKPLPPAPPMPPPPPPEPPQQPRAISQRQWSAEELDLDNLDLDEELARLEQREIQPTKAFGQDRGGKGESLSARRDGPTEEEQWPDSLFSEPPGKHLDATPADEGETAPAKAPEKKAEQPKSARTEPSLSFDLANLDDEPPVPRLQLEHDELEDDTFHAPPAAEPADDEPLEDERRKPKAKRERNEPGLHDDVLLDLVDDPIQLDWQRRRSPWGRRLLWLLLVLLAAGALVGQYVGYHFDELARQDQYRPWF